VKKHIPNSITILNLICGVMACISALDGSARVAAYFIAAGAVFDLLDGMVARMLGVSSEIGKQLDSLADMVTFGLAPALIARELVLVSLYMQNGDLQLVGMDRALPFLTFILVICSALRLAKFNIDEDQKVDFKGLPTPANALFWLSIPLGVELSNVPDGPLSVLMNPYILSALCVIFGLLLVSRITLFSMKFDREDKSRQKWQLILLVSAVLLFAFLRAGAIPLIIALYLLLSIIRNSLNRHEIQS
jgi:CDP-diacylglycerol--serine O-phosphatidyltransferase